MKIENEKFMEFREYVWDLYKIDEFWACQAWHRDASRQIQERYPLLRSQIIAAASKAVAEDLPPDVLDQFLLLPTDDLQSSFQLECITLPEAENGSWEATYSSSITGQKYTVTIEAWAITYIHHIS